MLVFRDAAYGTPTTHYFNTSVKLTIVTNLSFSERIAIATLSSRSQPHSALHVAVVEPPFVRPEEIGWHSNHSQLPKTEQGRRDSSDCDPPRRRGA